MFGNPETTPGGKALKFYSSVRLDIRRIGAIKQTDGIVTGNRTRVKVVKNKVAPPFTEAEFDIMYNEGISSTGALLDLALEKQIVEKRGSWMSYKGAQLAQGRDAAKEVLKNDPALYEEIEAAVKAKLDEEKKHRGSLCDSAGEAPASRTSTGARSFWRGAKTSSEWPALPGMKTPRSTLNSTR